MKKVLVFTKYYLPGFKAGGPIRSLSNLYKHLSNNIYFNFITTDRDAGETEKYSNEKTARFQDHVTYLDATKISIFKIYKQIKTDDFDCLYLNSFFDLKFTFYVLVLLKLNLISTKKIVLAPRGEFSEGALNLKKGIKNIYIFFIKFFGLVNNVEWQASTKLEQTQILKIFPEVSGKTNIACDLPEGRDNDLDQDYLNKNFLSLRDKKLNIVFLSRISPIKNLETIFDSLEKSDCQINFDIFGLIGDRVYWNSCKKRIKNLPDNINVSYRGIVEYENVQKTLCKYDLMFLPTLGENYCHAIAESIISGTPVLISDQTPWTQICNGKLGWAFGPYETISYAATLNKLSKIHPDVRLEAKRYVFSKAESIVYNYDEIKNSSDLFEVN